MGRREFLVKAGLVAGATVLTVSALERSSFASAFEEVTVTLGPDSPLSKVGGSTYVDSSAGKIIVIQAAAGKFVAFSAKCTHKGGQVAYNVTSKQLECPKHGSRFDGATGSVVNGPAERPIASYAAKAEKDSVTVTVGS